MERFREISQLPTLSRLRRFVLSSAACLAVACATERTPTDPLPSWNDGPAKRAILEFVAAVTDKN
ncbi:MAG: hypothetical protein ACYS9X_11055, partial [Planctomycetota bacterium]